MFYIRTQKTKSPCKKSIKDYKRNYTLNLFHVFIGTLLNISLWA